MNSFQNHLKQCLILPQVQQRQGHRRLRRVGGRARVHGAADGAHGIRLPRAAAQPEGHRRVVEERRGGPGQVSGKTVRFDFADINCFTMYRLSFSVPPNSAFCVL